MIYGLSRIFLAFCLWLASVNLAAAEGSRTNPVFETWSVDCSNTGLCLTSTYVREQAAWLDFRLVRDWPAQSGALIRVTTNQGLKADGSIRFSVDGQLLEELPVSQLREIQPSITTPRGFVPIGGEGFWYPTGAATKALLTAMHSGKELVIELPVEPSPLTVKVPLAGLDPAMAWLDQKQARDGTRTALVLTGDGDGKDAPHAIAITDPDLLPPLVAENWDFGRFCSDIEPAMFAGLGSVAAPFPDNSTLYLLPCGAPAAFNIAYVALIASPDGKVRQLSFARMSEAGPTATDLVYNAKWNPKVLQLEGLFAASGLGECGIWNRWQWTGVTFALVEEATRAACTGKPSSPDEWETTWPTRKYDE